MDATKVLLSYALPLVATLVFGWVVGYFVGQSDSDAMILAAVFPAVLSGIGLLVVFKSATDKEHGARILLSLSLVVFSLSLYWGSMAENAKKAEPESYNNLRQALKDQYEYLKRCSVAELRINSFREKLKLQPLASSLFCR